MEGENEPTVICENCTRAIPESKSFLHEAYCFRNVIRCSKCNEPVDKNELEEHEAEVHKMASCKYCKRDMEKGLLTNHEATCNQKPKLCPFCNCDVTGQEYSSHTYQCGSRTKKCSFCNKNILVRDFDDHEAICQVSQQNYSENFPSIQEEKKQDAPYSNISSKYIPASSNNPYDSLTQEAKYKNKDKGITKTSVESSKQSKASATDDKKSYMSKPIETKQSTLPARTEQPKYGEEIPRNMNNILPSNPSGRPSGSESLTTGINNLRTGPGVRGDTGAGKMSKPGIGVSDIQRGNAPDVSKTKQVSLGTRDQASSKSNLPDNTRAGDTSKPKPYESYKYGVPENSRAGVSTNVRPDVTESIRAGGYSNTNNIIKSSTSESYKATSASTSKPTSYGAKIETSSNARQVPFNSKLENLHRNISAIDPSRDLPAPNKTKESRPIFGNEPSVQKSSSQYEKGSIGGLLKANSNIETNTRTNVIDYRSGLTNQKTDLQRREDEYKRHSKLIETTSQKYSGKDTITQQSRAVPNDLTKKEPTSKYGASANTKSDTRTSEKFNERNYNQYTAQPSRSTQPNTQNQPQYQDFNNEDEELQRAIQASLSNNSQKPSGSRQPTNKINVNEEMQAGAFVDDPELQAAIQESLKFSGQSNQFGGGRDTWNSESFKRALEKSKHEK